MRVNIYYIYPHKQTRSITNNNVSGILSGSCENKLLIIFCRQNKTPAKMENKCHIYIITGCSMNANS